MALYIAIAVGGREGSCWDPAADPSTRTIHIEIDLADPIAAAARLQAWLAALSAPDFASAWKKIAQE